MGKQYENLVNLIMTLSIHGNTMKVTSDTDNEPVNFTACRYRYMVNVSGQSYILTG